MENNNRVELGEQLSRLNFKALFPYYKWLRISALNDEPPSLSEVEASNTYSLAADVEDFLGRRLNGASRVFSVNWGDGQVGLCIWLSITDEEYWLLGCNEPPDDKQSFIDKLVRLSRENPAKFHQDREQFLKGWPRPAALLY